ncbi:hypothetical protein DES45_10112 [Microvirga subterranea]|uniref:Uncharacterized protein n=1 Tax=Microvirga subterranea TaxID=186651 RepID=A0A370HTC8_9HYPH|nr:hypothetical protein DES45_10112 [Microvirga subterranea]
MTRTPGQECSVLRLHNGDGNLRPGIPRPFDEREVDAGLSNRLFESHRQGIDAQTGDERCRPSEADKMGGRDECSPTWNDRDIVSEELPPENRKGAQSGKDQIAIGAPEAQDVRRRPGGVYIRHSARSVLASNR